jgi:ABC-type Na+ transport system ATPase subunit NatA
VEVQVRKGLDDQAVFIVLHRRFGILLRQHRIHPGNDAVFGDEITVFHHIQAAIDELCKARTSLVIAHRLSTIEKADEILVIDEGHIVERGNHQTLMDMHGTYAQLRAIQFGNTATGNKG